MLFADKSKTKNGTTIVNAVLIILFLPKASFCIQSLCRTSQNYYLDFVAPLRLTVKPCDANQVLSSNAIPE